MACRRDALWRMAGGIFIVLWLAIAGCKQREAATSDAPATAPTSRPFVRVASLVPAATDLILSMGAGDHLVAVSNYDRNRTGAKGLPAVGDYLSTDWEQLAVLRPGVMIVAIAPDRMSAGLKQRAGELGIRLVNAKIDRLKDLFAAIDTLGQAIGEPAKAAALDKKLHAQLNAVRQSVAGQPPVKTLIVMDENATSTVGRDNFVNDLLEIAGGENALAAGQGAYPTIDREMLMSLRPDAVLQLMPEAPAQVLATARGVWKTMPQLPAVQQNRICVLSDWYVLLPGGHVGELAEAFARCLHGK
jgi:iron complex transport system substrate-binding protein